MRIISEMLKIRVRLIYALRVLVKNRIKHIYYKNHRKTQKT